MPAGRPTEMTDELLAKIEKHIIEGGTIKSFADSSHLSESTYYEWTYNNYCNFKDKLELWKLKAKLYKAESRADEILKLPLRDKDDKINPAVLSTVQKEAQFIRETIAKDTYSKRNELSGPNGTDLTIKVINYGDNNAIQVPTEAVSDTTFEGVG